MLHTVCDASTRKATPRKYTAAADKIFTGLKESQNSARKRKQKQKNVSRKKNILLPHSTPACPRKKTKPD